jgi:hypothetical protein
LTAPLAETSGPRVSKKPPEDLGCSRFGRASMLARRPTDLTLLKGTANTVELTKTERHNIAISDFRFFDSFTINFLSFYFGFEECNIYNRIREHCQARAKSLSDRRFPTRRKVFTFARITKYVVLPNFMTVFCFILQHEQSATNLVLNYWGV